MNTIDDPRFDQSELDRLLNQFEQAGPAVPEGAEDFCEAFELWIDEGSAGVEQVDGFRADLLFIRGMLDTARGEYGRAIEYLHDSIDTSRKTGNVKRHIFGLCAIATCFEYAGMQAEASSNIYEALELAEELGDELIRFAVLHGLSQLYQAQGAYEQVLESTMRTVAIAEMLDDRQLKLRTYSAISLAFGYLDRADEGLVWLAQSLDLVDSGTQSHVKTYLYLHLMWLHQRSGRLGEALVLAEEHLDLIADLPAPHAAVFYVDIAELQLEVGNFDRAGEMLEYADRVSDQKWMKAQQLEYFRVASELYEAKNEPARALEMLRRYMELEKEIRGRQAQTRLVALERHFAAELASKTDEVHHLRTVELVEKNKQLSDLIHRNDEILQVVVNDLRNPLAATRLLSDVLLTDLTDRTGNNAVDLVRSITSATVEMGEAVARLLASHETSHSGDTVAEDEIIMLTHDDVPQQASSSCK